MFRALVQELFAQIKSIQIDPALIEIPQDRSMGDFALPCFQFAKQLSKAPHVIAQEIEDELNALINESSVTSPSLCEYVSKIEALGPYVNVTLNSSWVAQQVIGEVIGSGDGYGAGEEK